MCVRSQRADAHMPILGTFSSVQGSSWAHSLIRSKLWCILCTDTFRSSPALNLLAICATAALLWGRIRRPSLRVSMSLWHPTAFNGGFFLRPSLVGTDHCMLGTFHSTYSFGDSLPSDPYIPIWPLSELHGPLYLPIFSAFNTSNLRIDHSIADYILSPFSGPTVMR